MSRRTPATIVETAGAAMSLLPLGQFVLTPAALRLLLPGRRPTGGRRLLSRAGQLGYGPARPVGHEPDSPSTATTVLS